MPTAPTHAIAALAIGAPFWQPEVPRRLWGVAALLSVLPDCDVIGFRFGIQYGDLWGHRGLTHSLAAAVLVAGLVTLVGFRKGAGPLAPAVVWAYLALALASHGFLDACTDGGLGIAFLSPWDRTRHFFPWRPLAVAPIGLHGLFRPSMLRVVRTEFFWVWCPAALPASLILLLRRQRREVSRAG